MELYDRVGQEVRQRLIKGDGIARFQLKRNNKIVSVTQRASGKYFVEVDEETIHRNTDMKTVVLLLIGK